MTVNTEKSSIPNSLVQILGVSHKFDLLDELKFKLNCLIKLNKSSESNGLISEARRRFKLLKFFEWNSNVSRLKPHKIRKTPERVFELHEIHAMNIGVKFPARIFGGLRETIESSDR